MAVVQPNFTLPTLPNQPSVSTGSTLRANFSGVTPLMKAIVVGVANAGAPATYGALVHPSKFDVDEDLLSFQYSLNINTNLYQGSFLCMSGNRGNDAVGDLLYVCLFEDLVPISGSVPLAVSGPIALIA